MDDLTLLGARVNALRMKLANAGQLNSTELPDVNIPPIPSESSMTTIGRPLGFTGGLLAAGAPLSKLYVEGRMMPHMSAEAQALSSPMAIRARNGLNRLTDFLQLDRFGTQAWQSGFRKLPRSEQAASLVRMYGKPAGLAGLGMFGVGSLLSLFGKNNDVRNLRQHSNTLAEMIYKQRQMNLARQSPSLQFAQAQPSLPNTQPAQAPVHPSVANTMAAVSGAGDSVGSWWDRMRKVYGG